MTRTYGMVATSHKSKHARDKNDHYVTPVGCAMGQVKHAMTYLTFRNRKVKILDPGFGLGRYGVAIRELGLNAYVVGIEFDEEKFKPRPLPPEYAKIGYDPLDYYDEVVWADYTKPNETLEIIGSFDLVIGNPPFKYGPEFVRMSRRYLAPNGVISFLLPQPFLTKKRNRADLHKTFAPFEVVHITRPSFNGTGKTDAREYIWVLWLNAVRPTTYSGSWGTFKYHEKYDYWGK